MTTQRQARLVTDTILLVEDEQDVAFPLCHTLEREGYDVAWVGSGREVFDMVEGGPVDCVILDLSLPDMDGVEVCRSLRQSGYGGGILMLTSRTDELGCVVGLDSGADDYVRMPCGLAELLARLRAILRRTRPSLMALKRSDSALRLDVDGRRAFVGKVEIALTNKEFGVLAVLEAHRDTVVTRGRLMSEVWDEHWYGSTKTLDVTIGRLRSKLAAADVPDRIVAVRGVGFRLEDSHELN